MTRRLFTNGSASLRRTVIAFLKRHQRSWYVGLVLLLSPMLVVTHLGELESFARLARNAESRWLFVPLQGSLLAFMLMLLAAYLVCTEMTKRRFFR